MRQPPVVGGVVGQTLMCAAALLVWCVLEKKCLLIKATTINQPPTTLDGTRVLTRVLRTYAREPTKPHA